MNKFKPWLLVILVFFAGIGVGVIGTRAVIRTVIWRITSNPDFMVEKIEQDLTKKLKLDPKQRTEVHQILATSNEQIKALREKYRLPFMEIMKNGEKEISAVLTPDQREDFEKYVKAKKAMWQPGGKRPDTN